MKVMKARWYGIESHMGCDSSESGELDLNERIKKIKATTNEDEFEELITEDFPLNLFNNDRGTTKEKVLKVLRAVKKRKMVFEVWEDGTIGISVKLSKKDLIKEVEAQDYKAIKNKSSGGNVSKILKG